MATIYVLENMVNGKCYVGQTMQSVKNRLSCHKTRNSYIGNALRKYGVENFKMILSECPEENLDWAEQTAISLLGTISPEGYNIEDGGCRIHHVSEETKEKLRGRLHTKESKIKMSLAKKGKPSNRKGVVLSPEVIERMRLATWHRVSEETKSKISATLKGKPWSEKRRSTFERTGR